MKVGDLVCFDPNSCGKKEQMSLDGKAFKIYETVSGHRQFGQFHMVPNSEVGLVVNTIKYDSIASERARVLFPSGVGWLDVKDLIAVTELPVSYV